MMYLMQAGGHSMWLVLLFGILTLGAATMFAFRPEDKGPLRNNLAVSPPIHPGWRRRSSVEYGEYSPSSLLASPAPRRRSWPTYFCAGPNRLGFVRGMTLATMFVVLGGTADALAATFRKVVETPDGHQGANIALVPMAGISESMSAAILGFSMLGLAWLITAAGCLRRPSTHS